jgi:hypothetical protein
MQGNVPNKTEQKEIRLKDLENSGKDIVRFFEILIQVDKRLKLAKSYETQNIGNPNSANQAL